MLDMMNVRHDIDIEQDFFLPVPYIWLPLHSNALVSKELFDSQDT